MTHDGVIIRRLAPIISCSAWLETRHKIIQKRLAFRHEQSVTARALKALFGPSGFRPAGCPPLRGFGGDGARRRRSRMEKIPMKLTDTQRVLLSAASQHQDGTVDIGFKFKGGAVDKVIGGLLSQRLIEEVSEQARCRSGDATRTRERSPSASPGFSAIRSQSLAR
jgi:hypothetical protein